MTFIKGDDNRVSVDREEYDAFKARAEDYVGLMSDNARIVSRNHDLMLTCNAQARRLTEVDMILQHHERVIGLQKALVDLLRETRPGVGSLEELSEFWRQWTAKTAGMSGSERSEVAKFEPDLFRTWRLWANNGGRSWSVAGTRSEVAARSDGATQADVQEDEVGRLKARLQQLSSMVRELESEIDARKKGR
jgi:hypothetical protein